MKKSILNFCLALVILLGASACKRKPEMPPVKPQGHVVTIGDLKAIASCTNACQQVFTTDTYVSGVVLADDVTGNFYKETYIRDVTGALHITFKAAATYFIGDSIRVNLNGLSIGYNPTTLMLEVDSVDTDKSLVIMGKGVYPKPRVLNMNRLNSPGYYADFINDLVVINGVSFGGDSNKLYVDINQTAQSRNLVSCNNVGMTLRTNSYAKFSGLKTPSKYGNIIGIATNYQTTKQLVIRNTTEWSMTNTLCVGPTVYLNKNFTDMILTSGGWTTKNVTGSINWVTAAAGSASNKPYASITNYPSNATCESWLISPLLDLSASSNPVLSFLNAKNSYTGNATLQAMISTNYVSGLPSTAAWTPITFNASTGNFTFVNSGDIPLNAYKTAGVTIAFIYTATGTNCPTWEVDEISIQEY